MILRKSFFYKIESYNTFGLTHLYYKTLSLRPQLIVTFETVLKNQILSFDVKYHKE